jgi:penicillin amidase
VGVLPKLPGDDGEPRRSFASNNWAVAPQRTAAGRALLAGDPHLDMTLPSLWFEAHLVVPGSLDVYGVTIPGAPGIIIGFTRDLAWSFTNTGADVLDLYAETVDDATDPGRYQVDGEWKAIRVRTETYRGKKGEVIGVDTLRFTHRGPMSRGKDGQWMSMRWTVLSPELSQTVFLDAARATTAREFLDRMAEGFGVPAQNMIVADRSGTIAIRSTGHYPIRPNGAHGYAIQDGSRSASDWQGYWPVDRYPQSFNPAQGFLASANQEPLDPRERPEYLGIDNDFDPWRALRINQLLRGDSSVTPETMRRWQTDPGSVRADQFVPWFLNAVKVARARGRATAALDSASTWLGAWDRRYVPDDEHAVLFEAAMRQLVSRTWDELTVDGTRRAATPSSAMLLNLLHDSASAWWDDQRTSDVHEDRDAVLVAALTAAHDSLVRRFGPRGDAWRWGKVGATRIMHLLGLPAFSERDVAVQGGPGTLNPASTGGHGPSWRMVVELGDSVRAWGTYPGGQSGNPFSPRYRDRLPLWRAGELDTLFAPRDTFSLVPMARLRLNPATQVP